MLRKIVMSAALVFAPLAVAPAAFAAEAAHYSAAETDIGTLLDNPETKAIIDKYMPGFSSNPQVDMARSMTLKQIQSFAPDQIKEDTIGKIDADLAKVAVKK